VRHVKGGGGTGKRNHSVGRADHAAQYGATGGLAIAGQPEFLTIVNWPARGNRDSGSRGWQ
jgi:hypothetical protein